MREDAGDIAALQFQQSQAISQLVMQGFDPGSAVKAIANNDMTLLKHTGLTSVQLHKPGAEPPAVGGATVNPDGNGSQGNSGSGAAAAAGAAQNKAAAAGASGGSNT
jgi:hypothetical protein